MAPLPEGVTVQKLEGKRDLAECKAIRATVFVDEMKVSASVDSDGLDVFHTHYLLKQGGKNIGTARRKVNPMGEGKISRVCFLQEARGKGLGKAFMNYILSDMKKEEKHLKTVKVSSQVQAAPFYEKLGFEKTGDEYMEADIPHIAMVWDAKANMV